MQVFRFTYSLKTRDNFARIAVVIISELQKAMKILSLFSCSLFLYLFLPIPAYFCKQICIYQKKAVSLGRKINALAPTA